MELGRDLRRRSGGHGHPAAPGLDPGGDGIDELEVLHQTGCKTLGPGRDEDDTRAARLRLSGTLDAIRAEVPSLDPACLSGFLYHEARDQLVTCP